MRMQLESFTPIDANLVGVFRCLVHCCRSSIIPLVTVTVSRLYLYCVAVHERAKSKGVVYVVAREITIDNEVWHMMRRVLPDTAMASVKDSLLSYWIMNYIMLQVKYLSVCLSV